MEKIAVWLTGLTLLAVVGVVCYRVQEAFMAASVALG
jgi:hypothetical protein